LKNSTAEIRISIRRPVTMAMIFMGAVVFGMKSYQELSLNLMPDLSYPALTVRSEYAEAAPEEVESFVTRPLEEALSTVSNLVEIRSVSSAGLSEIILEFWWGTDMDLVSLDVREKMDRVFLPEEVSRPTILRYNPAMDPVLRLGIYGDQDLFTLRRVAEKELKPEVEGLPGIASVKVKGGLEEEVLVEVDEARLARLGINMEQVAQRLWQENINLAGGSLREGRAEYLVRTLNEFVDLKDIGEMVVGRKGGEGGSEPSGALGLAGRAGRAGMTTGLGAMIGAGEAEVKLKDIATVRWGQKDQDVITRINGLESVEVEVYKEADSNTVQVADRVKEVLGLAGREPPRDSGTGPAGIVGRLKEDYPGVSLQLISDPSRFIKGAIEEVRTTAVFGGVLALLVLLFFLRDVKSTAIIGISIPVSILVAFIPMFLFDVSLNLMSLGGLALGIGMLVDNSIVVLESIFRCREEGDDALDASNRGTGEVAAAITASTLTTVAVFFPIVFVKGIAGQLFNDLALTVSFSLLASLLVALYLIPMFASRRVPIGQDIPSAGREVEGLGELLGKALRNAKGWLVEHGRPDRWLWEARVYLAGKRPACLPDSLPSGAAGGPGSAEKGTQRALLRMYGILHPFFEALRFVVTCLFGILQGTAALVIVLVVRGFSPVVSLVARGLAVVFFPFWFVFNKMLQTAARVYPHLLGRALRWRAGVIAVSAALFLHALFLLPRLGTELIPRIHQGQFTIRIEQPAGTPLEETSREVAPMETMVLEDGLVENVFSEIGSEPSGEEALEEQRGENTAELTVTMKEIGRDVYQEDLVIDRLRKGLSGFVGIQAEFLLPTLFSFKTPVEVEVEGNDLEQLRQISSQVEAAMREIPGLADIRRSARVGNPEVRIAFDRDRLARFGLDVNTAAHVVQAKLLGDIPTQLSEGETRYDIRVRADRKYLKGLEDLWRLEIELGTGTFVPLASLASMRIVPGPSEIRRVGQRRVAVVSANLEGSDLGSVSREIQGLLKKVPLPPGYSVTLGGQNREMQISFDSLRFAMLMAVFLVYIVMASQFESLVHPFVILFSIPLGFIGVVYSLYLLQIPMSIVVFIGAIMLAGIMVNNAIVLVDYINVLRRRGVAREAAIVQAGQVRLRPILMTTMTTVLGLAPMALGFGEGAEIRVPMAVTVIAGLLCSTFLTLLVVPVVYTVMDRRQ
jgi:hydrophobic/amphiphilic exporter-1 (mainly G- bacteria), HAE1 family